MSISSNFGKKGDCVANSYYMAKLLVNPAYKLKNSIDTLYHEADYGGLALNSTYEDFHKKILDINKLEIKKNSNNKKIALSTDENIMRVSYDTTKSNNISTITALVQDIHDTLRNAPANSVFVAATEDHNYLYVTMRKRKFL